MTESDCTCLICRSLIADGCTIIYRDCRFVACCQGIIGISRTTSNSYRNITINMRAIATNCYR